MDKSATLPLTEAIKLFSDEQAAERMFIEARWPDGILCPFCESSNIQPRPARKPAPFRCNSCRKDFSIKTNTVMHGSNLSVGTWALAAYLLTTNPKGISSLRLAEYLGVTQKTAWHLAHRIRRAWEQPDPVFAGPVEVDEVYRRSRKRNRAVRKQRDGSYPASFVPSPEATLRLLVCIGTLLQCGYSCPLRQGAIIAQSYSSSDFTHAPDQSDDPSYDCPAEEQVEERDSPLMLMVSTYRYCPRNQIAYAQDSDGNCHDESHEHPPTTFVTQTAQD